MKRQGNIYDKIYDRDNLRVAHINASKEKGHQPGVIEFNKDVESYVDKLNYLLLTKTYKTSAYTTFPVFEPKERLVYRLPYFPDRVAHHAVMNLLEPIFVSTFTADTYSCIKKRGIHGASYALRKALKDVANTEYCLQLDVRKFYPSVDHDILKKLIRRKIKDKDLLWLLDEIIDSADGLPIGNYLSQYLANFYLTYFDHWIKEQKGIKYYFRYADDIVLLAKDKKSLHKILADIREYFGINLKLDIKGNYQIYSVEIRGINFVGYIHRHKYVKIRKRIKQNFARKIKKSRNRQMISSYNGLLKHADCRNLQNKLQIQPVEKLAA